MGSAQIHSLGLLTYPVSERQALVTEQFLRGTRRFGLVWLCHKGHVPQMRLSKLITM